MYLIFELINAISALELDFPSRFKEVNVMKARKTLKILFGWEIIKPYEIVELPMAQFNVTSKIRQFAEQIFVLHCLSSG